MRTGGRLAGLFLASVALVGGVRDGSAAGPRNACERAGTDAERAFNLPSGLLLAIGRVESGRWDATLGRVAPWPWAANLAGNGRLLESKDDAVWVVREALAAGSRNIDVGCFQINLMHHPNAFPDLEQAFDPAANASYAARFLVSLRNRLNSWDAAVAAYHSANPERGISYQRMVLASWTGMGVVPAQASVPPIISYGIRIWTPGMPGPTAKAIPATPGSMPTLPRVISPGRY